MRHELSGPEVEAFLTIRNTPDIPDMNVFENALEYICAMQERLSSCNYRCGRVYGEWEMLGWHAHTDLPFQYYAFQEKMRTLIPKALLPGGLWDFFLFCDKLRELPQVREPFGDGTKCWPVSLRSLAIAVHLCEFC